MRGQPLEEVRVDDAEPNAPGSGGLEARCKGSWTASVAIVKPTATMARIQCVARVSRTTASGPQSIKYGDRAAVNSTTWLVMGRYRDAKAKPATASATRPAAV